MKNPELVNNFFNLTCMAHDYDNFLRIRQGYDFV